MGEAWIDMAEESDMDKELFEEIMSKKVEEWKEEAGITRS